jgi:predicted ATPase/class 3 adenylate cyclase
VRRLHAARGATYFLDDSAPDAPLLVTVLDQPSPEPARLLELETEHRITRELEIPGVRRALRRGEIDGRPALYSSWFAGSTLEEAFATARPPLERVLDLAVKAAELVSRLHAARVLHGRLGPAAFRVDAGLRELELSGLGFGTRLDVELPHDGRYFASDERSPYASPEQTGRMNRPVDWRSDLYSLGATLYLMLTGRAPFEAADAGELAYRLIAVEPKPPAELAPDLPELLSDITLKLLAKDAEDRYQSAEALRADLERCRDHLERDGKIPRFQLALHDAAARFRLPRKLYARDAELAELLAALTRAATGQSELVLVGGVAGVGKTALVRELLRPLALRRGRYVEGKFDQFQRELPFSAFAQAFAAWVHHVLSESDAELVRLRERVKEAVGELGGLLTRLVPDLELLIGAQPAVPEVGPSDALHRFQYVLRRFLLSLSDEAHPLVLFVDDLQWADPASLELLTTLMSNRDAKYLLVIGAYRTDEIGIAHALQLCFDDLERAGAPLRKLELGLLDDGALLALVSDALSTPASRVQPLAELVRSRTEGNALFVRQLLQSLYEDGVVRFNHQASAWEWDLARAVRGQASGDVLALFGAKTARLPDETRDALIRGAYLGSRFEVATLAKILGLSLAEIGRRLEPAVREELLVPVGTGHRYVAAGLDLDDGHSARYVFPHDRVQQAIYSLVPEGERPALHLEIGRRLSGGEGSAPARSGDQIFQLAHQLNRGRALIEEPSERRALSLLDLEAALTAKRSGAYAAALEYLTTGIEVVGGDGWRNAYSLALRLHSEAAECAYLAAAPERMATHTESVLTHGRNILDKMPVFLLLVDAYTSQNRLNEALSRGLEALRELGVTFPASPKLPHIMLGLARTKLRLSGKDVSALARQRPMTDPHKLQAMLLLERMVPPAYMSGSALFPLLVFSMVDLSVKYGNSPLSAFGYASFAITLSGVLGDIRSGTAFGKLGFETLEHTRADPFRVKVLFVLYVFIKHWTEPLASCAAPLLGAYRYGMEAGNLVGATWSAYYRLLWLYFTARPLAELEREAATYSAIFHDLGQDAAYRRNDMLRQVMLNLMGRTADPIAFSGETYRDAEIDSLTANGDDATSRFFYYFNKQTLCFLFGRYAEAVQHGDSARSLTESVTGLPDLAFWAFWDALARIRSSETAPEISRPKLLLDARRQQKKLAKWGRFGPANYQHKHDLVQAELCRVRGRRERARELYDRAIEGATASGFVQEAALAAELAARFHLESGRRALAGWYLQRARRDYLLWGAIAKADALEREHGDLLVVGTAPIAARPTPGADIAATIDLSAVVKATQAISGEIVLERLAAKLLDIAVENAGAESGALVLFEGAEARIAARKTSSRDATVTGLAVPVQEGAPLPVSVLQYVARTKRAVVVDDAAEEPRFVHDPYIVTSQARSILCAPIVHHGDLVAAIYLDNRLSPRVFTTERLELLTVLGGQIAISLENAKLYGNLRSALDTQVELTRAYSRFTPRAFLDFLNRDSILDVRLGDHRHGNMTVMCLDIRDYTALSETLSAGDNFRFLNGFFSRMTVHVARRAGVLSTFTGDGFLAFFPGHPRDAFEASVDIQAAVRAYNRERTEKQRAPIAVGIGLHTGPLMLGVIGDQDRLEASLISDTVNTAARMEGLTKQFKVRTVASESTINALPLELQLTVRRVGDVRVKGKSLQTRVYDCFASDSPEAIQLKRATAADFSEGLDAWRAADFARCTAAFQRVLSVDPSDGTARRYLTRASEQLTRGASADWTGVEIMDRK